MHRRAGPQEGAQLLRDRPITPPVLERMKDELTTTIRILLPAVKLVVDGPVRRLR